MSAKDEEFYICTVREIKKGPHGLYAVATFDSGPFRGKYVTFSISTESTGGKVKFIPRTGIGEKAAWTRLYVPKPPAKVLLYDVIDSDNGFYANRAEPKTPLSPEPAEAVAASKGRRE